MINNDQLKHQLRGDFQMKVTNKETGELIDSHMERNIIVDVSKQRVISGISNSSSDNIITKITVGDDIGSGTLVSPEPPNASFTKNSMNVVYAIPSALSRTYPTVDSVQYDVTISGADLMAQYPSDASKIITSAMLQTGDDEAFAYKRFKRLTISELVDVTITWTISY